MSPLTSIPAINLTTLDTIADNNGLQDAFNALRVSQKYTVAQFRQIFDDADILNTAEKQPYYFDNQETSGGGTATTFNINQASTTLSVSANTAGTRVRQSKRWANYQPGKGGLVQFTGVLGTGGTGITKRYGLFYEDNVLFFEQVAGVLGVVVRSKASGSVVNTRTIQSAWNIDPMDGTGPSGITLDQTKSQIFVIDFQWLAVGRVRFALEIDGMLYYVHESLHANRIVGVYMSTANLPIRVEISNDGTGGADSIAMICAAVNSEGGQDRAGVSRVHDTDATPITLANTSTTYPLLGIRLRTTHRGLQVDPQTVSFLFKTTPDTIKWTLQINPTLSGEATWANLALSGVQVATGNGTLTITAPGIIIASDYETATATSRGSIRFPLNINEKIGSFISGATDQLWLCARPLDSSTDVHAALKWLEGL